MRIANLAASSSTSHSAGHNVSQKAEQPAVPEFPLLASKTSPHGNSINLSNRTDLYQPVLEKQGVNILQDAIKRYIKTQNPVEQGKLFAWIYQLLQMIPQNAEKAHVKLQLPADHQDGNQAVRLKVSLRPQLNLTPADNYKLLNPVLLAEKGQLLLLLNQYGAIQPSFQDYKAAKAELNKHSNPRQARHKATSEAELAELLLKVPGLRLNNQKTPLQVLTELGYNQALQILLENGADPNALDSEGHSALNLAVRHQNATAIIALLKAGADPSINAKALLHDAASLSQNLDIYLVVRHAVLQSATPDFKKTEIKKMDSLWGKHANAQFFQFFNEKHPEIN